ncbi:MAG TPA: hypothetical protein VK631_08690 [Solirubrobacteraceae bacterium]|nr:hypothetical protein [Solirubrobacteraceae bacterium]
MTAVKTPERLTRAQDRTKPYVLGPRLPLFSRKRKDFHPAMRAFHAKQARKERS